MNWISSLPFVPEIHRLEEIDSTNTYAKALALENAEHLTLVIAKRQVSGRGRTGRHWISPEGNVYWSIILRPTVSWPPVGTLPFVASLSVKNVLSKLSDRPDRFAVKWPNDTLLDGKKVSGILQESTGPIGTHKTSDLHHGWIVVGVGINVLHHPTEGTLHPATSLTDAGFDRISRDEVIRELTATFCMTLETWVKGGYAAIKDDLLNSIAGVGGRILVRRNDKQGDSVSGIFEGLDPEGYLILKADDGTTQRIVAGDLFMT
jgi:BirA family biotin operon repressor/biotin-[acetyl-CoA-carboxylase] ligase